MIDHHTFSAGLAVLATTYARPPVDPATAKTYYAVLSARLTTEEFTRALERTLAVERFWPSPAVIMQHAGVMEKPDPAAAELLGREAFATLLDLGRYSPDGPIFDWGEVEARLGAAGVRAFRAIGGPSRLRDFSARDETFIRKEFATAYATAIALPPETRMLSGGVDPKIAELVRSTARTLDLNVPTIVPRLISGGAS